MQIAYGQGAQKQPPALWLTELPQRLSVIATLLVAAVIGRSVASPEVSYLTFIAASAAYAAVAATLIGLVLAVRRDQSLRELVPLLIFSLVLAHVSSWAMLDPRGPVISVTKLYYSVIAILT